MLNYKYKAIEQAKKANITDLYMTEKGIFPLSLLKKSPLYTGKLIKTITPHNTICNPSCSKTPNFAFVIIRFKPQTKLNKLIIATVDRTMNIGEGEPNSMVSCKYR